MKDWTKVAEVTDFTPNAGGCIKLGDTQIAVFNYDHQEWYAVQNLCPHKEQMVLSRGLIGDKAGEPKVACPLHKKNFSLKTGQQLGESNEYCIKTYPIKVEQGAVYLQIEGGLSNQLEHSCSSNA